MSEDLGSTRKGAKRFWTAREEAILRAHFPLVGAVGCAQKLTGRSPYAINQHARKMGLQAPPRHRAPQQFYSSSPHIDEAIRRVYQGDGHKGAVEELARTLGRPRWWIRDRALRLGLQPPRFKEPPWTSEEIEIAAELSHRPLSSIQSALKRAGYRRSESAIAVKLKRIGTPMGRNGDPDRYTGTQLARLFGVTLGVVRRWIIRGWLVASRRGTARTAQQGGDEWWIHRRDVVAFIFNNPAAVDLRKAEKFWLLDLLAQPAKSTKQAIIVQLATLNPHMPPAEIAERAGSTPAAVKAVLHKQRMRMSA